MSKSSILQTASAASVASLTVAEVDDPARPGEKVRAVCRAGGFDFMKLSGKLNPAQIAAGEAFAKVYERANNLDLQSVDFGRVRVDGGKREFGSNDTRFKALARLLEVRESLGERPHYLLAQIVGKGRGLSEVASVVARMFDMGERAAMAYAAERTREALADLAELWGVTGPARARMRADRSGTVPAK